MERHIEHLRRTSDEQPVPQPTIADKHSDLLQLLDHHHRQAIVVRLTVGYYDGWRPTRSEVADMVAVALQVMSIEESMQRQRVRTAGGHLPNIADRLFRDNHRVCRPGP